MRIRLIPFVLLGGLVTAVGCDSGPKIVKISGTAMHKNQPVPGIRITFVPDKGRPSHGDTDEQGKFTLEYDEKNKGAVVGMHTVSVTPVDHGGSMNVKASPLARIVTDKYSDMIKSPMKIEITKAEDNLILNFD